MNCYSLEMVGNSLDIVKKACMFMSREGKAKKYSLIDDLAFQARYSKVNLFSKKFLLRKKKWSTNYFLGDSPKD